MNNNQNNISFFLHDKPVEYDNSDELKDIIHTMELSSVGSEIQHDYGENLNESDLDYYLDKSFYGNDELYYNQECTVKDLLKICQYYSIDKCIKTSKCKKPDIIDTIVYFENLPENKEIVKKRNRMWAYMQELSNDPKMKKYLIWS